MPVDEQALRRDAEWRRDGYAPESDTHKLGLTALALLAERDRLREKLEETKTDARQWGVSALERIERRTPRRLFRDAIERALGWASEGELRDLVARYTGVKLSLGDANRFSQDVAAIVVKALVGPEVR